MSRTVAERRAQLKRVLSRPHELSEALEFYGELIDALIDEQASVDLPLSDEPALAMKRRQGQAILYGESLGFDVEAIRDLLLRLCAVTERAGPSKNEPAARRHFWSRPSAEDRNFTPRKRQAALREAAAEGQIAQVRAAAAAQIRGAIEGGQLDLDALVEHVAQGHEEQLAAMAMPLRLDPNLLVTLTRFAMRPVMLAYADAYESVVKQSEAEWMRGDCPVCGGPPLMAEYHDDDQSRRLRCATCGTSWLFRRLECPHCGTDKFRSLTYFKVEGDPIHQVDLCDECHHYVKALVTTDTVPGDVLPLEDLLTLHLDAAAQKKGYLRR